MTIDDGAATRQQVGRRIRRLRDERAMSLSRLAVQAGIGKGTLSELEAGNRNPTLDTLYAVAAPLEVSLATLLGEEPGATVSDAVGDQIETTLLASRTVAGRSSSSRSLTNQASDEGAADEGAPDEGAPDGEASGIGGADAGAVEVYWLRMGAHGVRRSPAHGPTVREHLLVVSGSVEAGPTTGLHRLGAGESVAWASSGEHEYRAGDDGVEAVLTIMTSA